MEPALAVRKDSFGVQAAKFSLYAPIVAIFLALLVQGPVTTSLGRTTSEQTARMVAILIGGLNLILLITAAMMGVGALIMMRTQGRKGILVRASVGTGVSVLILAAFAYMVVTGGPSGAVKKRLVGEWKMVMTAPDGTTGEMVMELKADGQAKVTSTGVSEPVVLEGPWAAGWPRDSKQLVLQVKVDLGKIGAAAGTRLGWEVEKIEADRLELWGKDLAGERKKEVYTRVK